MKTTQTKLAELKKSRDEASKEYNKYLREFNKERNIEKGTFVNDIIALHRQGLSKQEIVLKGYNKNYVSQQIRFYTKGKRVAKTPVARFLEKKKK